MMASEKAKKDIVDALMTLLAEKPFDTIGLREIADLAGVSLGELREAYDGKISILAEFVRRTDKALLDGVEEAGEGDTPRDRLFDIVMRRLDLLAPYKAALGHLEASARRDPGLLLCLNRIALDSARFMLAAAGIGTGGLRGAARAQGLVALFARLSPTWREDADPDQSRTMAALDRAIERTELWDRRSAHAARILCSLGQRFERRRRPAAPPSAADGPSAA